MLKSSKIILVVDRISLRGGISDLVHLEAVFVVFLIMTAGGVIVGSEADGFVNFSLSSEVCGSEANRAEGFIHLLEGKTFRLRYLG